MMARKSKIEVPKFLRHITARRIERCSGPIEPQTETCKTDGRNINRKLTRLGKRFTRYTFTHFGSKQFWVGMR